MSKVHMVYLEDNDVLHVSISDEPEADSVEDRPAARIDKSLPEGRI